MIDHETCNKNEFKQQTDDPTEIRKFTLFLITKTLS